MGLEHWSNGYKNGIVEASSIHRLGTPFRSFDVSMMTQVDLIVTRRSENRATRMPSSSCNRCRVASSNQNHVMDIILELGQPKGAAGYHFTQSYVAILHTLFQHPSIPSRILGRVKSLQLVLPKEDSPLVRSVASKSVVKVVAQRPSVVKVVAQRPSRERSAHLVWLLSLVWFEALSCHRRGRAILAAGPLQEIPKELSFPSLVKGELTLIFCRTTLVMTSESRDPKPIDKIIWNMYFPS